MDRAGVEEWLHAYELAWRTTGTAMLSDLFAPDVSYRPSPWSTPLEGLEAVAGFWEDERKGPDEEFVMSSQVVAVDGAVVVVRVSVDYGEPLHSRWRDLWVVEFADDRRCRAFEEWPFAPDQHDGH